MEGCVDLGYPALHQPGVEPAILRSLVRRPNHYTIEPRADDRRFAVATDLDDAAGVPYIVLDSRTEPQRCNVRYLLCNYNSATVFMTLKVFSVCDVSIVKLGSYSENLNHRRHHGHRNTITLDR